MQMEVIPSPQTSVPVKLHKVTSNIIMTLRTSDLILYDTQQVLEISANLIDMRL